MLKCIEMNLHIFSIGYEFSHDVAYKAHIFGFFGRVDGGMIYGNKMLFSRY